MTKQPLTEEQQEEVLRDTRLKRPTRFGKSWVIRKMTWALLSRMLQLGAAIYVLCFVFFYWQLSLDEGPFTGVARSECPQHEPDQSFGIAGNKTLLIFDATVGDNAPTVALQKQDGSILWCVFATGLENSLVYKLRFTGARSHPIPFFRPYLRGWVGWSFGIERMTWSLDRKGNLRWYKYSW